MFAGPVLLVAHTEERQSQPDMKRDTLGKIAKTERRVLLRIEINAIV